MPIRQQQDATLSVTSNIGANASTTNTNAIDLGAINPFPVTEGFSILIATTAGTNAANNKNVTIQLQHSNVNTSANFVNVPGSGPLYIPEVSGGYAATNFNVAPPPDLKQFLRAQIKVENLGGKPTDGTVAVKCVF